MSTVNYTQPSEYKVARSVTKFPINKIYVNTELSDPNHCYYSPSDWLSSRSPNKCIGLREAKVIPWHGVLSLYFCYDSSATKDTKRKLDPINIDETTTTYDIIAMLCETINNYTRSTSSVIFVGELHDNTIQFNLYNKDNASEKYNFHFIPIASDGKKDPNILGLLKALNQIPSDDNYAKLTTSTTDLVFKNVWDRNELYIHSTLSNEYNNIVCEYNQEYQDPETYLLPTTQNVFKVWFTTDTENIIQLYNCRFVLKLAFIYNYRNVKL